MQVNGRLVFKETGVLHQCGGETRRFVFKQVDKGVKYVGEQNVNGISWLTILAYYGQQYMAHMGQTYVAYIRQTYAAYVGQQYVAYIKIWCQTS